MSNGDWDGEERRAKGKTVDMLMKAIIVLSGIVVTISMGVTGWTTMQVTKAHERIHVIELSIAEIKANRFTSKDGQEMLKLMMQIKQDLPKEVPPSWFIAKVERIEKRLENHIQMTGTTH